METQHVMHLKQIKEGVYFLGWMKIGKAKFDWELRSRYKFRGPFRLTLKKDGRAIKLTSKEYSTFYQQLVSYVMYICCTDEISSLEILRNGVIKDFGLVEFTPEAIKMLNQPKFDCQIPL